MGLLFFGLRLLQLRSGFDPETGLALPSAAGTALAACLAAAAALEALLALRLSKEKIPFRRRFAPVGGMKMALVMGAMLLIAGSALMAACAVIAAALPWGRRDRWAPPPVWACCCSPSRRGAGWT